MDEDPNPGENEEPEARLSRIPPSECKKRPPGAESGDGWRCSKGEQHQTELQPIKKNPYGHKEKDKDITKPEQITEIKSDLRVRRV
jgi:hypothetical protein